MPALRRVCLRSECQKFDRGDGDSAGFGEQELRTAKNELHGSRIVTDTGGQATGVEYYQGKQAFNQPCRAVVVSCSATESARLLLNSATRLFPRGLGNNNDWVGRN